MRGNGWGGWGGGVPCWLEKAWERGVVGSGGGGGGLIQVLKRMGALI